MNAVEFLKGIKEKDEVIIIFHNDSDGMCSAAILAKFVVKRTGKKPFLISQPTPVDANVIDKIKTALPTKIIITDIAIDQQAQLARKIAGFANVLVIDHHIITNDIKSSKITYHNPRAAKPSVYQSASYICYKICSKITEMEDAFWLACAGAIADYNLDDSKDIIEKAMKKYKMKDVKNSPLSKAGEILMAGKAGKSASCEEMADMLKDFNGYEEFFESERTKKIRDVYEEIETEIRRVVAEAHDNIKQEGDVIFYEIKARYNIRSPVSTIISEKHRNKIVLIYEKTDKKIKVSARNQDKNLNAGRLLEEAAKAVGGSGGGHEAAAGATIPAGKWNSFREIVVSLANK